MLSLSYTLLASITIAVLIIALTWLFARTFFFSLFRAVLRLFSEYVTRLQTATTGAQVLNVFAYYLQFIFPSSDSPRIIVWFAFNRRSQPLVGYNVEDQVLNSVAIRTEIGNFSGSMLVNTESVLDSRHLPRTADKLRDAHRVLSYPFIHKGSLFGVVHVFLPRMHIGFRRRSLAQLYAQVSRARFTQLAAERDTLRIASDIGAIERSFEALIDAAPVGMVICETDLSVRYMNETAGKLLEIQSSVQTGTLLLTYFPEPGQRKKISAIATKILGRRSAQEQEARFEYTSAQNTTKYFDIQVYPIKSASGKIIELIFVLRDATERYLLEEELAITQREYQRELEEKVRIATRELVLANRELTRLNQVKSEFVSTISHELRTPLTSIIGYLSLLESKKLGNVTVKQRDAIRIIVDESRRLASLISDILDLSRLESGKTTMRIESVKMDEIVKKVLTTMQPLIDKKHQTVSFDHREHNPVTLAADPAKIQQIVLNILSNAVKFTPERRKIQIRLLKDSHSCILSVQDQGIGIPAKDLPHIFEPFHRSETAHSHAIKGTGLGLPIVKHLVDLHHGKITIQSHANKGTRVTVILPLKHR